MPNFTYWNTSDLQARRLELLNLQRDGRGSPALVEELETISAIVRERFAEAQAEERAAARKAAEQRQAAAHAAAAAATREQIRAELVATVAGAALGAAALEAAIDAELADRARVEMGALMEQKRRQIGAL